MRNRFEGRAEQGDINISRSIETAGEKRKRSSVVLELLRHEKKEGEILSKQGRSDAFAGKKYRTPDAVHTVAISSPVTRSGESAILAGMGDLLNEDDVLEYVDFADLKQRVDRVSGFKKPFSKSYIDKRLGFAFPDPEMKKAAITAIGKKELLKWVVEESNQMEQNTEKKGNISYDSTSAEVASIILKYVKVSGNFDRLVKDKKVEENEMRRIMGSHSGVVDTFLAKLIEKTKGVEERNKFLSALGNDCFNFLEGFRVEIIHDNAGKQTIRVDYDKEDKDGKKTFGFHEEIPLEVLEDIASATKKK